MLEGSRFARVSYTMFAVAVSLAVLKLGGALDSEPPFLETVPAEPVAKTSEPASVREAARGERPERPGEGGPAPRYDGRFAAGFAGSFVDGATGRRAEKAGTDAGADAPVFRRPSGGASSGGGPVCGASATSRRAAGSSSRYLTNTSAPTTIRGGRRVRRAGTRGAT